MRDKLGSILTDESGATAIEYAVIAALVAAVAVPALSILGGSVSAAVAEISSKLNPGSEVRLQWTPN